MRRLGSLPKEGAGPRVEGRHLVEPRDVTGRVPCKGGDRRGEPVRSSLLLHPLALSPITGVPWGTGRLRVSD